MVLWREGVEIKLAVRTRQVASKFAGDATSPGFPITTSAILLLHLLQRCKKYFSSTSHARTRNYGFKPGFFV